MEPLEVGAMAAVVLVGVPVVALRLAGAGSLRSPRRQLALAIVPGTVGALIALLPRLDLLRDSLEAVGLTVLFGVLAMLVVAGLRWFHLSEDTYD